MTGVRLPLLDYPVGAIGIDGPGPGMPDIQIEPPGFDDFEAPKESMLSTGRSARAIEESSWWNFPSRRVAVIGWCHSNRARGQG